MKMNKNASLSFTFHPENYADVDLTFYCSEDLSFDELLDFFKRFAIAMSFTPETIKNYFGEE